MRQPEPYRFTRETHTLAPKPGHHLATVTYQHRGESVILWMIEGPENDALTFRALSTNFDQSEGSRFRLAGDAIENLSELPYSPYGRQLTFELDVDSDHFPSLGETIFSTVRAPNKLDPDSALVRYTWPTGERIDAAVTELRRAWAPTLVVCGAALAIGAMLAGRRLAGAKTLRASIAEEAFSVSGDFVLSRSVARGAGSNSQALPASEETETPRSLEPAQSERPFLSLAPLEEELLST